MRLIALLGSTGLASGLIVSSVANAGGIGIIGTAGLHEDRAYYYRDDGLQGIDTQNRPNMGGGIEMLIGDRDDRVQGIVRLYSITDWPLNDPDLSSEDTQNHEFTFPAASAEPKSTAGAISVGVQWGLWGDPTGFELVGYTLIGSGFATTDNLEFLILEPAIGVTQTFNERYQLVANVAFTGRYRKQLSLGENVYVGMRYLFD